MGKQKLDVFIITHNHNIPQINYKQTRSPYTFRDESTRLNSKDVPTTQVILRPFAEGHLAANLFPHTSLARENIKNSLSFIHGDSNRTAF